MMKRPAVDCPMCRGGCPLCGGSGRVGKRTAELWVAEENKQTVRMVPIRGASKKLRDDTDVDISTLAHAEKIRSYVNFGLLVVTGLFIGAILATVIQTCL